MITRIFSFSLVALLVGCAPPLEGKWDIEVVDADDCTMELDVEQKGGDVEGDADVDCRLYFTIYGEQFYYDMDASSADVEGEIDGDEFELEVSFYDDFFEDDVTIVLEGEIDGDDIEGDVTVDGEDFGEFEGSRS